MPPEITSGGFLLSDLQVGRSFLNHNRQLIVLQLPQSGKGIVEIDVAIDFFPGGDKPKYLNPSGVNGNKLCLFLQDRMPSRQFDITP